MLNKKALPVFLALVILLAVNSHAEYTGGSGSLNDPYQISTVADWQHLMDTDTDWDKHFVLTADLDMQGVTLTPIGYYKMNPRRKKEFSGSLEGNGFTIRNIGIDMPNEDNVGLFGYTEGSVLKNINIENMHIVGDDSVGGLVGFNYGTISNISSSGVIYADEEAGGIVGVSYGGAIRNCDSSVDLYVTSWFVGGIVGYNCDTPVIDCSASGDVVGTGQTGDLGGLIGGSRWSYVINCSASGNVTGRNRIGGLIGWLDWYLVKSCYSTGNVQAEFHAGGLIGELTGIVENSYSAGDVNCIKQSGGFIGADWSGYGHVLNCMSTGAVTGTEDIGGFIGNMNSSTVYYGLNFFDADKNPGLPAIGDDSEPNIVGKTTTELSEMQTFVSNGWDFAGETQNGSDDYWVMPTNGGYPILSFQLMTEPNLPEFGGGDGSIENPFLITSTSEFNLIGDDYRLTDKHFKLANDLDFAGMEFRPIGSYDLPFTGSFDGNKKIIMNVVLMSDGEVYDYLGIFASLDCGARVFDLGVENLSVQLYQNRYRAVGGIAGDSFGATIKRCYVSADITDASYGGLIVGDMYYGYGKIENCYAIGSISGDSGTHGIVGKCSSSAKINDSYTSIIIDSAPLVNKIYPGETSQSHFTATHAEMMDPNTFLNSGWDFVDEEDNGSEDIWGYFEGSLYPQLAWQFEQVDIEGLAIDVASCGFEAGIENSLLSKLYSAARMLEDEDSKNVKAAINKLRAFINSVKAQRGKKIAEDIADKLIADAETIIESFL